MTWGLCVGVLALPMLVDVLVRPLALGPDYGVARAGIVLAEVAVVISWLVSARKVTLPQRSNKFVLLVLGGWVLTSILSTITADHFIPALLRSAEWIGHGMFAFVLWSELQQTRTRILKAQRAIAIGFTLLTLLVVIYALRLPNATSYEWSQRIPYLGVLGQVRYFGIYALAGFTFSTRALLDPTASRQAKVWSIAGMTLAWGVMLWTGGRASVGAGFIAAAALWWMGNKSRVQLAQGVLFSVVTGGLLSLCLPVESGNLGLWRVVGFGSAADISAFTSGRTELWLTALAAWKQQPWLGLGPGASPFVLAAFGQLQPHNLLVQAIVEWGMIGALFFVIILVMVLYKAFKNTLAEEDESLRTGRLVASAYIMGAMANAMLDGLLYDSRTLLLIVAAVAMTLVPIAGKQGRMLVFTAGMQRTLAGVALTLAILFLLHLSAVRALWLPVTPAPGSARVALLQGFPSPSHLRVTGHWVQEWQDEQPEAALELARWGGRYALLPWFHIRQEADLLLELGYRDEAMKRYDEANRLEKEARYYIIQ